jgi:hypothetical protein
MTDKVVVVTSPDDVLIDGYRILIVGLTSEQSKVISDALLSIDYDDNVILYIWESGDSDWLLDKKHKSNLIIFNADHDNQLLVGYMAAQKNSHYFGYLKFLASANAKSIYASEDAENLLISSLNTYD